MEALLGVIIGGIIGIFGTIYTTRANLLEARRKAREDFLIARMEILAATVAEYEEYLAKYDYQDGDRTEHAKIIGKAIAVCLSISDIPSLEDDDHQGEFNTPFLQQGSSIIPDVPDDPLERVYFIHRLTYIANHRLTRNFVKSGIAPQQDAETAWWGVYQDRNRSALDHATKRLALLIARTQNRAADFPIRWRLVILWRHIRKLFS